MRAAAAYAFCLQVTTTPGLPSPPLNFSAFYRIPTASALPSFLPMLEFGAGLARGGTKLDAPYGFDSGMDCLHFT